MLLATVNFEPCYALYHFNFITVRLCIWTPHSGCIKLGMNNSLVCHFVDARVLTSNIIFNEAKRVIDIQSDSVNVIIEIKIGGEVDIEIPGRINTNKDLIMHSVGVLVGVLARVVCIT